jgi:hypothetical protein
MDQHKKHAHERQENEVRGHDAEVEIIHSPQQKQQAQANQTGFKQQT